MKKKYFQLFFIVVISIFFIAISIPHLQFSFGGKSYRIRGLRLSDLNKNTVLSDFSFNQSLSLHGGKQIVYDVDLTNVVEAEQNNSLQRVRNNIDARLRRMEIGEYKIYSLQSANKNQIVVETAFPLSEEIIQKLVTKGEVGFWTIDFGALSAAQQGTAQTDPYAGTIFQNRKQEDVTNQDLNISIRVSDAKIFLSENLVNIFPANELITKADTQPRNFGMRLFFTKDANTKLQNILSTNPSGYSPVIITLDYEPVAIQASGDLNASGSILLYPFGPNDKVNINLLAAKLSLLSLDSTATLSSVSNLAPWGGSHFYADIVLGAVIAFVLAQLVWFLYFRKRAYFGIIMNILFVIWIVGLLKVSALLSATLDWGLIVGVEAAIFLFAAYLALITFRIRTKSQGGLVKEEIEDVINASRNEVLYICILILVIAYILLQYGTFGVIQLATGIGFGAISALLLFPLAAQSILMLTLLRKTK
ncbi:MAG: hypothetical protein WCJ58_04795 [bacterium]